MSSLHPGPDPILPPIAALVDVFGANPEALCFPGVDHPTLVADATSVRDAAAAVARCEQALAEARATLDESRKALRARATRGLAYARVYAEDDAELQERLTAIELSPPRGAGRRGPKKAPKRSPRTRRKKAAEGDDSVTELPFAADADATDSADAPPQAEVA